MLPADYWGGRMTSDFIGRGKPLPGRFAGALRFAGLFRLPLLFFFPATFFLRVAIFVSPIVPKVAFVFLVRTPGAHYYTPTRR